MAQSLAQVYVHIITHTKYNLPFITEDIEDELYAYIGGIITIVSGRPISINDIPDHIHILAALPRTMTIAKFVEEIKRNSSRWIKTKGWKYPKFAWQNACLPARQGYGAFSVGYSQVEIVSNYIANQKNHHKKVAFREEYLKFLKAYKVDYNEEYLWT
jgi:REP-associated tyrosine transposase